MLTSSSAGASPGAWSESWSGSFPGQFLVAVPFKPLPCSVIAYLPSTFLDAQAPHLDPYRYAALPRLGRPLSLVHSRFDLGRSGLPFVAKLMVAPQLLRRNDTSWRGDSSTVSAIDELRRARVRLPQFQTRAAVPFRSVIPPSRLHAVLPLTSGGSS